MLGTGVKVDTQWIDKQIEKFIKIRPRYLKFEQTLNTILSEASRIYSPHAIIQTRTKSISSYAEKIVRKIHKYHDPIRQMTDLCGGRVITHTQNQVRLMCKFIEDYFKVDWDNTIDVSQRLKPTEFGYRSVHYIIQFKPEIFPTKDIKVNVTREVFGLKAEVQVRTILEHAWADIGHEWIYKNEFKIPEPLEREMASWAAMLETTDQSISRMQERLKKYHSNYGIYLTAGEMKAEIEKLEIVLKYDPHNLEIVLKLGKLALTLEDWDKVIEISSKYKRSENPGIMRNLGIALCKKYKKKHQSPQFKEGQAFLEKVAFPPCQDVDAMSSLAGSWKGLDDKKATEYYKKAFDLDPTDSYPLGNYLESEIHKKKDLSMVQLLKSNIEAAMVRCRENVEVGVNLPWAYYDMGKFYLFLGEPYKSFSAYARAIDLSSSAFMVETTLESLRHLATLKSKISGYPWMINLLTLGLAIKRKKISDLGGNRIGYFVRSQKVTGPVIILIGDSSDDLESRVNGYSGLLSKTFQYFSGTVISGGTTSGISKLAGNIKDEYRDNIELIGYIPQNPSSPIDRKRYDYIRKSQGQDFSPLEVTQYWYDILISGIDPGQVKILGINGGLISGSEYRLALMLGAYVGILDECSHEAARLFYDEDWNKSDHLIKLPPDPVIMNAFITFKQSVLSSKIREKVAVAIHSEYCRERIEKSHRGDIALSGWDQLPENLKESNRLQADHIYHKLNIIRCNFREVKNREIAAMKFTRQEIEKMAELEHARWVVERLIDGWKLDKTKNISKKLSPYLVGWEFLSEEIKDFDRETVKKIPDYLAEAGFEVYRLS